MRARLFEMSVRRCPFDADDFGDVGQVHSVLSHPLRVSEFRRCHLRRAAAGPAAGSGGSETDLSPFTDEVAFEFGESTEDGKDQFAAGSGGVDRFGRRLEADTAGGEVFHSLQEVRE